MVEGAVDIYRKTAASEYSEILSEAQRMMGEHENQINNNDALPAELLDDAEASEETIINEQGEAVKVRSSTVPVYEIGEEHYARMGQSVKDWALEKAKTPLARNRLKTDIDQKILTPGQLRVQANMIQKRNSYLTGITEAAITNQIQAMDEEGAQATAMRALTSGIYTAEKWAETMDYIGTEVDKRSVAQLVDEAENIDQLDNIDYALMTDRGLRLEYDDRKELQNYVENRRTQIEERRDRMQSEVFGLGVARALNGTLSGGWVNEQIRAGRITPEKANTLRSILQSGSTALTTDKATLSRYKREINNLRYLGEGETLKSRISEMREKLFIAANGVTSGGRPVESGASITGEDYETLLGELDEFEKEFRANPQYKDALKFIEGRTGVTPAFQWSKSNAANLNANTDFIIALNDYLDRAGSEADPMAWVKENESRFDPEAYRKKDGQRFLVQYPEFSGLGVRKEGAQTDIRTLEGVPEDRVLSEIYKLYREGRYDKEGYLSRYQAYMGTIGESAGALEALKLMETSINE